MCEPELDLLSRLEQELATTLSALKVENEEISQQETDYKARERELATSAAAAATAALKRESELAQRVDDLGAALFRLCLHEFINIYIYIYTHTHTSAYIYT